MSDLPIQTMIPQLPLNTNSASAMASNGISVIAASTEQAAVPQLFSQLLELQIAEVMKATPIMANKANLGSQDGVVQDKGLVSLEEKPLITEPESVAEQALNVAQLTATIMPFNQVPAQVQASAGLISTPSATKNNPTALSLTITTIDDSSSSAAVNAGIKVDASVQSNTAFELPKQVIDMPQQTAEIAAPDKFLPRDLAATLNQSAPLVEKAEAIPTFIGSNVDVSVDLIEQPVVSDAPSQVTNVIHPTTTTTHSVERTISIPVAPMVGRPEWSEAFSQKVVWMANQQQQVADLQLNPPNLGPVEVRLTLSNDQANLVFVSQHAAVREAIQSSLPRLTQMFADSGLMMGSVFVGSESLAQQHAQQHERPQYYGSGGNIEVREPILTTVKGVEVVRRGLGMVDTFA